MNEMQVALENWLETNYNDILAMYEVMHRNSNGKVVNLQRKLCRTGTSCGELMPQAR